MTITIAVEASYVAEVKKLPPDRLKSTNAALVEFQRQPSSMDLQFSALGGRPGYFTINANRGDRVILRRDGEDSYAAVDVGPYDNFYRRGHE